MTQTLLPFATAKTIRQIRAAQDRRNSGGANTSNETRLAELERRGRYGKRCPKCGTVNVYRRLDGTCLGCAMKEERA